MRKASQLVKTGTNYPPKRPSFGINRKRKSTSNQLTQVYLEMVDEWCVNVLKRLFERKCILYFILLSQFRSVAFSTCNTRGHSMKLYYPDSRVLARQNFFSVCVVQVWNNLPNEVVSATCVGVFKSLLNSIRGSFLMLCFSVCYLCFLGSRQCSLSLSAQ